MSPPAAPGPAAPGPAAPGPAEPGGGATVVLRPGDAVRGVLALLAATALFGTVGTARVLGPEVSAWSLGAARLALGALGLLALAALAGTGWRRLAAVARHPAAWGAGAGMAAFQATFLAAVEVTGVAVGTLVAIGSAPLFTGLLGRTVTAAWARATAVAVAGLALLVLAGGPGGGNGAGGDAGGPAGGLEGIGTALALGAGLSYAAYIVATQAVVRAGHSAPATAATSFVLAAVLLAPALVVEREPALLTVGGVLTVGYLAAVPTTLSYALFTRGLQLVPARTAASLGLTEPLVAAGLGVVVLDERLGGVGLVGAGLVLAGLLLVARAAVAGRAGSPHGR